MGILYESEAAEREADRIAEQFQNSNHVMSDMARMYHADFSDVRIHTDAAADRKVRSVDRDAIAQGKDLFFGRGIFEQHDPASNMLVAHELAHTMQQGVTVDGGAAGVQTAAPAGAAQGGRITDWFRSRFGRKKKIGDVQSVRRMESSEMSGDERTYAQAMRALNARESTAYGHQILKEYMPAQNKGEISNKGEILDLSQKVVNDSSRAYRSAKGRGDDLIDQINSAFVALGHRSSGEDSAKLDSVARTEVFDGTAEKFEDYMHARESRDDYISLGSLAGNAFNTGMGNLTTNAANVGLAQDMLAMLGNGLTSERGIDYLKTFRDQIQGADVFKEGENPLNFMLSTIMTAQPGKVARKLSNQLDSDQHIARVRFINQSMKNVNALPTIDQNPQLLETMPEEMLPLYEQYIALKQQLETMLAG